MSSRFLPESHDPAAGRVDLAGQALTMVALGALTVVLVEGRSLAWPTVAAVVVLAVGGGAGFIWVQRRVARPMLPLRLLRSRLLVVALVAMFAMTFGTYGLLTVNGLAFQQQRGATALATAVALLPLPLVYLALIPAVGALAQRVGPRPPTIVGLGLMGAGMLLYAAVGPGADLWLLETAYVLAGAGLVFNTGPAVGLAMAAMPVARAAPASGVVNLARLVGITVGVAVLGTVLAVADAHAAVLVGGVVELVAGAAVVRRARPERVVTRTTMAEEVCHA
jgi:MFS family permease